jgi:hypothetical protein
MVGPPSQPVNTGRSTALTTNLFCNLAIVRLQASPTVSRASFYSRPA